MRSNIRNIVASGLFALAVTGTALCQDLPALVLEMGYADTILVNGKIVSLDDRSTVPDTTGHIYEAMAIKGKKIMALGSSVEMRRLGGPKTSLVDLGGKTVIPGLIQPHYHLFGPAAAKYGPQMGFIDPSVKVTVVAESTAEATAKKLRDTVSNAIQVQKIPKGQWVSVELQEGKMNRPATNRTWLYMGNLNRRQLDSATPNNPVLVKGRSAGFFNAVAIEEIKKDFPDWEDSTELENGPGRGRNGYAAVPELSGLAFEYWWRDKPLSDLAEVMRLQGEDVIKAGFTTVGTRILYPRVIAAFHDLNRQGKMVHRLAYYVESQRGNFFDLKSTREFYRGNGAPWTNHVNGGEMLWLNGMCNEIWDSTQNEVCLGPDVPAPPAIKARERCPAPGTRPWEAYRAAILNGWRPVQAHGTSSHGARLYVQMLDQVMKEGNFSLEYMRNLRTTLEHNFLLGNVPDVIAGLKKYGVIINVNTGYLTEVPELIRDYGDQLTKFSMPVKSWINQGIQVTFESLGLDPWTPIYTLVTRKAIGRGIDPVVLLPEEGIDRVSALKMTTTWASDYVMGEDTIGTLEPGKFADFAVLDRDFFTIPVDDILNVKVVMTGLNGQIVYQGTGQSPSRPAAMD